MPRAELKYQQIAAELRAQIQNGTLPPGAPLPAEAELAMDFDSSVMTVRQALDVLVAEGRIAKQSGRRATVREYRPKVRDGIARLSGATWASGRDIWSADADGRPYYADNLSVTRGEPTPLAAALLELDDTTQTVIRSRRYFLDRKPVLLADSYIPLAYAAGTAIESDNTGPGGTFARLADQGHAPARFREDLRARMPEPDEAAALELPAGTPVVEIVRTAWDESGTAVEVTIMTADASSHIFRYAWRQDADLPATVG